MISLDIDKPRADTRVVVAMSGGVDSAVTAALVAEAGYDAVGITLQLYDDGAASARKGACCAGQDIYDARRVADAVGIPHYVLDYRARFRASVIEPFAESYVAGETPIPCVTCNRTVKFRDLMGLARDLGADALATGHYVRRLPGPDGPELHRAVDDDRDQSYFLFATTRDQLDYLRFPLGGMTKDAVRREAERLALPVADKPDSQDICFVPNGGYARVVERLRPGAAEPGEIVDLDGRRLGGHDGTIAFHRRAAPRAEGRGHWRAALRDPHRARGAPRRGRTPGGAGETRDRARRPELARGNGYAAPPGCGAGKDPLDAPARAGHAPRRLRDGTATVALDDTGARRCPGSGLRPLRRRARARRRLDPPRGGVKAGPPPAALLP